MKDRGLIHWGATLFMAAAVLILMSACSSTHIQSTRIPAGLDAAPFRKVVVAGVDERPEIREPFENGVVASLREHGVEGTASHMMFSFDEIKGDKEQIRQRLLAAGAESVLYVRVSDRGDFAHAPPASLESTDPVMDTVAVEESRFNALTRPGGDLNTALRLGIRLYRVSDGAVVWSAVLDTVKKEDSDSTVFIRKTAKAIVERLAKDKVIP